MSKTVQSPGNVLKLFLRGYGLNPTSLARGLKLSKATVRLLTLDKTKISVHVALRLAKFFSMEPGYWLELQNSYDLSLEANNKKLAAVLKTIHKAKKPTAAELAQSEKEAAKSGPKAGAKKGPKAKEKKAPQPAKAATGRRGRQAKEQLTEE